MHLRPAPVVEELQRMVPVLRVAGGSFADCLPHPHEVSRTDRQRTQQEAEQNATGECLADLVASVGLPAVEPARMVSGARQWPKGYTGSVSHQGTTVVAAIASTDRMRSIGIDIERMDGKDLPALAGLDAVDHPWPVSDADARVILFSVKEAVYKALHPVFGRPLHFADIAVSWLPSDPGLRHGRARAHGVALDVRCSLAVPSWIVSAAMWPLMLRDDALRTG